MGRFLLGKAKAVSLCLAASLAAFAFYRVLFYLLNRDLFGWVTPAGYGRLFFVGFLFDFAGIAYFNLPYVLLALLPLGWLGGGKGRAVKAVVFLALNAAASALASIDLVYYRYTLARSTRNIWNVAFMGGDLGPIVKPIILEYWWIAALLLLVTFLQWLAFRRAHAADEAAPGGFKSLAAQAALLLFAVALMVVMLRGGVRLRPMELNTANYLAGGENVPLVTNTPYVMVRTFRKSDLPRQRWFDGAELERRFSPVAKATAGAGQKPLNVVVIVMESLSREYLGPPWGRESLTPRFNALAARGLLFPDAFANGKQSIEAMPAITASIPSLTKDPFVTSLWSANVIESLASLLAARGYDTAFYHGGRTGTMGIDGFAKAAGYSRYRGLEDYTGDKSALGEWGVPDEPYLGYFADELGKMKQPFLATVFTLSAHHPFTLPPGWEGKYPEGKHPITKMVSYADEALGRFFEKASKEPWFADTLFVVTADHCGPAFAPEFTTRAGAYRVPLLFYRPADPKLKGVNARTAQQLDVMPTVLDYLGYSGEYFALGKSLLGEGAGFAINSRNGETLCISGNLAVTRNDRERAGIFNLAADPLMKVNLAATPPGGADALDGTCKAFLQTWSTALKENRMTAERWKKGAR